MNELKVLHAFSPCEGHVVLDISTPEKLEAAYLYMFRYMLRHSSFGYMFKLDHSEKTLEGYRLTIGEIEQRMKEKLLMHGKDEIRLWLQDKRRSIKEFREMIAYMQTILPVYQAAKKGDGKAAVRLFTDPAFNHSEFQVVGGLGDIRNLARLKVLDPRNAQIPKRGSLSNIVPRQPKKKAA